ncbi:protein ALTERED PHOSPHATE STARVATION RESPONSE 1-like [Typha angustifolia]|uniref:protein ALTERED PHOSPHATE STARVATION RESPONSE 1-like n=1 Tax=Typha angustifolia TaxID=59011 RepID=UPI003C2D9672
MGCGFSKLDHEQEAVAFCRRRTDLLAAAIHYRYALSAAHAAYSDSLTSSSSALKNLLLVQPPLPSLPSPRKPESYSDGVSAQREAILKSSDTVQFGSFQSTSGFPKYSSSSGVQNLPPLKPRAPSPPPPSPPRANTWDFLNLFETYENYYPSRSPEEAREVSNEANDDEKSVAFTISVAQEDESKRQPKLIAASSKFESEEPGVVDKKVINDEAAKSQEKGQKFQVISVVVGEIKAQFDRASDAANELSLMLEVGKQEYHSKNSIYHVCSRMVCAMIPSSISVNDDVDFEEDKMVGSSNLSSALDKLYSWERKLYDEVKAEEKMRLLLVKNSKRLKALMERGAEAYKIDSTRNLIWKLSTKIRIAIQVIDSISEKINKLRDEELWPLITTLIQGFVRMWRVMLDCHRVQRQAISEAKHLLDLDASGGETADASMQLEIELTKWMVDFSSWVNAQRNYVKALNGWLSLCLHYEPEETADGVPTYSPGRIGAPPVFVVCNIWSQAVDRISEREVTDAMQALAASVRHVSEQQSFEQQHEWMIAIRERDRWVKAMEKKMQEIHKEVDVLNRKLARVPGQIGLPLHGHKREGHTHAASSDLQTGLRHLLEALENFSASSLQVYDELYKHAEEKRMSQVYAKLS